MATEVVKDQTFRPKSKTCYIVLASASPCAYPKVLYMACFAWNKVFKEKRDFTVREAFAEAIREAKRIYEERCGVGGD